MIITDAQVHVITRSTPERRWRNPADTVHHGWEEFGTDRILDEMDRAGVASAVVVPTHAEGDRNDTVLAAARDRPDRFRAFGRIDLRDPTSAQWVSRWRDLSGLAGVRLTFRRKSPLAAWLRDGTADWFWPAAEAAELPVAVHAPGQLGAVREIAKAHPNLKIAIDHMGVSGMSGPVPLHIVDEAVTELLTLAPIPNVAVKASALPSIAQDEYPYRSLHRHIEMVIDAFGTQRVFWGSDLTRLKCPYLQCVTMFTEALTFLTDDDLDWVMGRALRTWLDWHDERSDRP